MMEIIIKTILIVFNVLFILGSARDFNNDNTKEHNSLGYICFLFFELIILVVII